LGKEQQAITAILLAAGRICALPRGAGKIQKPAYSCCRRRLAAAAGVAAEMLRRWAPPAFSPLMPCFCALPAAVNFRSRGTIFAMPVSALLS